jgi:hypothetical protein
MVNTLPVESPPVPSWGCGGGRTTERGPASILGG